MKRFISTLLIILVLVSAGLKAQRPVNLNDNSSLIATRSYSVMSEHDNGKTQTD